MGIDEKKPARHRFDLLSGRFTLPGLCWLMMWASAGVQAAFYGRLEMALQQDNFLDNSRGYLEQQAEIHFVDKKQGFQATGILRLQQGEGNQSRLQSLWLEQQLPDQSSALKTGRFPRMDGLGFYSLDGISIQSRLSGQSWSIYAGIPRRLEDHAAVEAELLYGIDASFADLALPLAESSARISLQHLQADQQENRLGWNLSASQSGADKPDQKLELVFSGECVLDASRCEQLQVAGSAQLNKKHRLHIALESWTGTDEPLGFREKFYSDLIRGHQLALTADWFYNRRTQEVWHGSVRHLRREIGDAGYEITAALTQRAYSGETRSLQLDYRALDEDRVFAAVVENERPVSAYKRLSLSAAVLHKQQSLYGYSRRSGIDFRFEQAFQSDLIFTLALSRWWDSRLPDESQVALSLSYYFDLDKKGAKP